MVSDHEKRLAKFKASQAKAAGKKVPRKKRLPSSEKPDHPLWYLLNWYRELRGANPAPMGHQPIPYSEFLAFAAVYDLALDGFDADTLRRLDALWLKSRAKHEERSSKKR